MTRDEEIEKLAMVYCEGYAAAAMPASVLDQFFAEGVLRAEAIIAARDRYRAARQPAPETPTPRIEEAIREMERLKANSATDARVLGDSHNSLALNSIKLYDICIAALREKQQPEKGQADG